MKRPGKWNRAVAHDIPSIIVDHGVMRAEGTRHQAVDVGDGRWVFTGLPGRQFTPEQAEAGMRLAIAPERLEAAGWADSLGLTVREATGLLRLSLPADSGPTELCQGRGLDR
ncbi:hypothetical protein ACFVMC_26615 [Nocardia sp. NPDC127579]|uniref:hypothetical protein n=1 Tax=Nocardia sp. NPDC127579 TaxID=3345402 RepID=UPI003631FB80